MNRKKTILIIVSNYYEEVSDNLIKEATQVIEENNTLYQIEKVTGVFEIPSIVSFSKHSFDGYVTLGCVIRGETSHYDYVCSESARALMDLSLEGLAIGYGIVTVENYEQAIIRSKTLANKGLGKGKVAALACLNQINLKTKYTNGT